MRWKADTFGQREIQTPNAALHSPQQLKSEQSHGEKHIWRRFAFGRAARTLTCTFHELHVSGQDQMKAVSLYHAASVHNYIK